MQKEPNSTQNLEEKLTCHFESKDTIIFNITFLVFLIPAVIGVILAGYWLWLIGYIAYWFVFIQIWENKTLCSHCPHYNEEEKTIRCYGNKGIYKLWKYNPKPMSISHQIQFIVGKDGRIKDCSIIKSSGHAVLDRSALDTINNIITCTKLFISYLS